MSQAVVRAVTTSLDPPKAIRQQRRLRPALRIAASLLTTMIMTPAAVRADAFITDVCTGGITINQNGVGDSDNTIG